MSNTLDPREERLPRWAQDTLRILRVEYDLLLEQLNAVKGLDPREPVAVRDAYRENAPVAWSEFDRIRFYPTSGNDRDYIDVRRSQEGEIEVSASGTLVIRPVVSNVIRLETKR